MISPIQLPYREDELEPWVSAGAISVHYALYKRYVHRVIGFFREKGISVPSSLGDALEYAATEGKDVVLLHNVQQALNHELFWHSMSPPHGGVRSPPTGRLAVLMRKEWGSMARFVEEWVGSAVGLFGSGYVWLTYEPDGEQLEIWATVNSDQPWQLSGRLPLLCMDVWEHAFIFDYPLRKADYAQVFLHHLVNWRTAEANLEALL